MSGCRCELRLRILKCHLSDQIADFLTASAHKSIHMHEHLVLASASEVRKSLLEKAGLRLIIQPSKIDEISIKEALTAENVAPRDISDALAEAKALKASNSAAGKLVLGSDQILACDGKIYSKALDKGRAMEQLRTLRGKTHHLYSAAVLYDQGRPVWRHVGHARMTMRPASDAYLEEYIDRNWESIRLSVGCYKLEEEGVRLFSSVQGDYFTVLGLPLIELLSYLMVRGTLPE